MPNISGQAYGLTVVAPILPGHLPLLQKELDAWGDSQSSPLRKTPKTHLARWVIIPQLVTQKGQPEKDVLQSEYLLFESNFDGANLDLYLEEISQQIPEELDRVWVHCSGYPGARHLAEFQAYIKHNQIDCAVYVAAYPGATVDDVRRALRFRDQFRAFAIQAQRLDAAGLQKLFRAAFPGSGEGNAGPG